MIVTKNLIIALCIICFIPLSKAQNCVQETILFNDGENFFAIPNAFTPNNDGLNDVLTLFNSPLKRIIIMITNPADSTEIFRSEDLEKAWDGLDNNGEIVPEGIYKLRVDFLFEKNDAVEFTCLTIYLIRENCLDFDENILTFASDYNDYLMLFTANTISLPDCTNSIFTPEQLAIRLFPNPVSEKLFFESPLWIDKVRIFEPTGTLVFFQNNLKNQSIDIATLQTGLYFIQLKSQQITASKMIMIK